LVLSFIVILLVRGNLGVEKFNDFGWRIPFLISALLVIVSIYIRLRMRESPLFSKLKGEGKTSVNPLKESFTHKLNLKMVLLALFGATMGQGVIWYTGQFYAQSFIENTCKVSFDQSRTIVMWAIILATPFFVVFGSLSDKIGRKWIMLLGMLLAVCTYNYVFSGFVTLTDPAARRGIVDAEKTTASPKYAVADAKDKKKMFVVAKFDSAYTDGALYKFAKTDTLALDNGFEATKAGHAADTVIGFVMPGKNGGLADTGFVKLKSAATGNQTADTLYLNVAKKSAKPSMAVEKTLGTGTYWMLLLLVFVLVIYATMVYGPIAAFLVEMFPTRIRYTSMSLPYHIGNGVFGGLVPFLSTLIITYSGSPLAGLWYPVIVAGVCFVIGLLYLSPTDSKHISEGVNEYVS
jgi:MFS family permease